MFGLFRLLGVFEVSGFQGLSGSVEGCIANSGWFGRFRSSGFRGFRRVELLKYVDSDVGAGDLRQPCEQRRLGDHTGGSAPSGSDWIGKLLFFQGCPEEGAPEGDNRRCIGGGGRCI